MIWKTMMACVLLLGFYSLDLWLHEEAHLKISEYYGIGDAKITYNWNNLTGSVSGGFKNGSELPQSMVEIADYVIVTLGTLMIVLWYFRELGS